MVLKGDGDDDEEDERYKAHIKDFVLNPTHQKLKMRMLIVRMKLLHVIRSFHFYLMTRVSANGNYVGTVLSFRF